MMLEEDKQWERGEVPDFEKPEEYDTKHRWWKITVFPTSKGTLHSQRAVCRWVNEVKVMIQKILHLANIICCIVGIERCPNTDELHAHMLLGFSDSVRYRTIKNILRGAQIRYLEGDLAILSWYRYVVKAFSKIDHPDRVIQWGANEVMKKKVKMNNSGKRSRSDLFYDNKEAIEQGRFDEIDPLFRFDNMSKINRWYLDQHRPADPVSHDRLVFIYGKPGVGKTSLFSRNMLASTIYWKNPGNRWWCGYRYQPIVIIDEITPKQFQSGNINWNIIGDRNEVYVEVKGSQVPLQARWVIVISNYSLDQLCSVPNRGLDDLMKRTFKRRCGNQKDGYRIYYFPENPPADNGNLFEVSRRVKEIWKVWYYEVYPYFANLPEVNENDE